jgi:hypothetical protein
MSFEAVKPEYLHKDEHQHELEIRGWFTHARVECCCLEIPFQIFTGSEGKSGNAYEQ